MKLSARNQLKGTVESVTEGAVNSIVAIKVGNDVVKANITSEAVRDLALEAGKEAVAIVKATNVMFAAGSEKIAGISTRNQICGKVVAVSEGAVNGHITVETAEGVRISGSITNEAIESLGLTVGSDAVALVKSTDVIVGVE